MGGALVQTGKALDARPVAVVSTPHKAQRAAEARAYAITDLSTRDLHQAVAEATGRRGGGCRPGPRGRSTAG